MKMPICTYSVLWNGYSWYYAWDHFIKLARCQKLTAARETHCRAALAVITTTDFQCPHCSKLCASKLGLRNRLCIHRWVIEHKRHHRIRWTTNTEKKKKKKKEKKKEKTIWKIKLTCFFPNNCLFPFLCIRFHSKLCVCVCVSTRKIISKLYF